MHSFSANTPRREEYIRADGYTISIQNTRSARRLKPSRLTKILSINTELLEMFDAGLANLKENGKYQEILDKYIQE